MARTTTITAADIAAIAEQLKSEGRAVTSRAVREALGNTGSMGTINNLLRAWKDGQAHPVAATLTLPPALQRAILDMMAQEIAAGRAGLEAELAEAQQEAQDLARENERIEADRAQLEEQIEQARERNAKYSADVKQLESIRSNLSNALANERQATETARVALAKAELRLEALPRLEADLVQARTELALEREARHEAQRQAAGLAASLESSVNESEWLKADRERVFTILDQAQNKLKAVEIENARLDGQAHEYHQRLADLTAELAKERAKLARPKTSSAKAKPTTAKE